LDCYGGRHRDDGCYGCSKKAALAILRHTTNLLRTVQTGHAKHCGFPNPFHFSRKFKEAKWSHHSTHVLHLGEINDTQQAAWRKS
jgi:hypothetical protein